MGIVAASGYADKLLTTRAVAAATMFGPVGPATASMEALYSGLSRLAAEPVVLLDSIGFFLAMGTPEFSGTPAGFFSVEDYRAIAGNAFDCLLSRPYGLFF